MRRDSFVTMPYRMGCCIGAGLTLEQECATAWHSGGYRAWRIGTTPGRFWCRWLLNHSSI